MKKTDLIIKVFEMFDDDREFVERKLYSIIKSRSIDLESFDNDYRLPKMVINAIYKELSNQRKLLTKEDSEYSNNIYNMM